jgi:Na+-driven multidrug efflux pump
MVFIGLPVGYLCGITAGWGLPGFWAGYGASNLVLACTFLKILTTINWVETAEIASRDELSFTDLDSQDDDRYVHAD